jgi:hypothetical protein
MGHRRRLETQCGANLCEQSMSTIPARLLRLWKFQDGLCYWCGLPTFLPGQQGYLRPKGTLSGKAATYDHLYSRNNPRRHTIKGPHPAVMACNSCNHSRAKVEQKISMKSTSHFVRVVRERLGIELQPGVPYP